MLAENIGLLRRARLTVHSSAQAALKPVYSESFRQGPTRILVGTEPSERLSARPQDRAWVAGSKSVGSAFQVGDTRVQGRRLLLRSPVKVVPEGCSTGGVAGFHDGELQFAQNRASARLRQVTFDDGQGHGGTIRDRTKAAGNSCHHAGCGVSRRE